MEKSFFLPFFLLFCLFVKDVVSRAPNRSTDDPKNIDTRIVGGYNITIQDVPYHVLLFVMKGEVFEQCGGSIISETYVLTAAHCLTEATLIFVIAGTTIASSGGSEYNTTIYTNHPLYNPERHNTDYDIGLINIPGGITLDGTNTRAVALPDENSTIAPGTNIIITGWGRTKENGTITDNLMAVQIPTISNDECRQVYSRLTPQQFCAGVPEGGKDSCTGDSGGPAVATDSGLQIGVISSGRGCGRPGYPGVYTDVASVRTWIRTNAGV
ncbi:unnamed protein product [Euphydryas editha]|uniref:Peptidase S1 domain-containing protein n=1 Tax=Euphydryas editha TaxID=104508 RepID=A0AAU9UU07_EUPED|nr:unnamed protein product [Euphydryas editha]